MLNNNFNLSEDFVKVFENWTIWIAISFAVLVGAIKGIKKIKKEITSDNFITIHGEIHELLTELRVITDAARTQVIQFHNGEYFMDGISMRKFSLTHESVEKGIESDGERVQGFLCSMFLPLLLILIEDNPKVYFTTDLKENYVKQYFEARNVEAFSVLPIKINNLGMTTDDFNNEHARFLTNYFIKKSERNLPFCFHYISYKEGTDILTESQQYRLCLDLLDQGYKVYVVEDYVKSQCDDIS